MIFSTPWLFNICDKHSNEALVDPACYHYIIATNSPPSPLTPLMMISVCSNKNIASHTFTESIVHESLVLIEK